MAELTYATALDMCKSDSFSQFYKVSTVKHIVLHPKHLGKVKSGVTDALNSEKRVHSEKYGFIVTNTLSFIFAGSFISTM